MRAAARVGIVVELGRVRNVLVRGGRVGDDHRVAIGVVAAGAVALALATPSPNPLRGHTSTTIAFTLARSARVRLEVFDLLGRRVAAPLAASPRAEIAIETPTQVRRATIPSAPSRNSIWRRV